MKEQETAFIENLRFNQNGLIPAIAQDWLDGSILMMAWMNKVSLKKTIESGEIHYWSRGREEIWHKGATSGHTQILKELRYDCDSDTLLLVIEQTGDIACHEGKRSCFFNGEELITYNSTFNSFIPPTDSCSELFQVIEHRQSTPESGSYTNSLLKDGQNRILKKIGEESAEFIMACKDNDKNSIANEAADLIFHLQVALAYKGVRWREVLKVLKNRRKAPRRKN